MMEHPAISDDSLLKNIETIRQNVRQAALESGRTPQDITILAATKTQSVETINKAVAGGIRVIGENRVQELLEKYDGYDRANCSVQFIGHLQQNKVKYIVDKVDMIQSVDSLRLAGEIEKQCAKLNKVMDVLIEVNIGREEAKSGVYLEDLRPLLKQAAALPHIRVRGLMAIPPVAREENANEQYFRDLYRQFLDIREKKIDNIYMDFLSMGMSGDYACAVRCGANMIRVGTALFGARNK